LHGEPVEPEAHPRRLFGWRSRGIGHRHVSARAGQRPGGFAPDACPVHRSLRHEAVARPGAVVERHRPWRTATGRAADGGERADGPIGRGSTGRAGGDLWLRSAGPVVCPAPGASGCSPWD
jgi:hypothetical protein